MSNQTISQSQKRFQESIGSLFVASATNAAKKCLFLKSSTDTGVIRNGGRNGAKHAPQSFLSAFKKMTHHESLTSRQFYEVEVGNEELETKNFAEAQSLQQWICKF